MSEELIKELSIEDLPEVYQEMAYIIGVENTVKVAEHFGGLTFYLPKVERVLRDIRDTFILREFNGANHRELAAKYKLSEKWVRKVVQKGRG